MSEFTDNLNLLLGGDERDSQKLLPLVYEELRKLAQARMALEFQGQTLQPTALVHEAYLRLIGGTQVEWDGRGHFFAAAAEAMRRILIERARKRKTQRAGGELKRVDWTEDLQEFAHAADSVQDKEDRLLELDRALDRLQDYDERKAQLVKLRFFAGLTGQQAAQSLGISQATADRDWSFAKAWLQREIDAGGSLD